MGSFTEAAHCRHPCGQEFRRTTDERVFGLFWGDGLVILGGQHATQVEIEFLKKQVAQEPAVSVLRNGKAKRPGSTESECKDRKSVVEGKHESVRDELGCRGDIKQNTTTIELKSV